MPTSVWISGATSTTGGYLLPMLLARGLAIEALSRQPGTELTAKWPSVRWLQTGLEQATAPSPGIDTLISLGPLDAFVEWLARLNTGGGIRQIVAFGSTSVHTKADSSAPDERALAQALAAAEMALATQCARLQAGGTLLRPTLIYGGERDLVARLANLGARWHLYPWLLGAAGRALRQPVHAQDLATAVLCALDRPCSGLRRIDLPGAEALSLRALMQRAGCARKYALPIPLTARLLLRLSAGAATHPAAALGPESLARLQRDQVFSTEPAKLVLGWTPRPFCP